jgi:hypothetical protein
MVNVGFVAGVTSLGQSFISTNKGSVLGITPNTTPQKSQRITLDYRGVNRDRRNSFSFRKS